MILLRALVEKQVNFNRTTFNFGSLKTVLLFNGYIRQFLVTENYY